MKDEKNLPIVVTYSLDSFLMYLTQEVTNRSSADIMNFYHELCTQVAEIGLKNRTGRGIKKKIDDYFPGSSIPFHLELTGYPTSEGTWNEKTRKYENHRDVFKCHATVGFPARPTYMKEDMLHEIATFLMERDLLGVEVPDNIKPFEKPETSSPKMYKDLMDRFAGRPIAEKKARKKKNDSD